jgi:hypothetical protein
MKKVIELLERAEGAVMLMGGNGIDDYDEELCDEAIDYINEAMALLKAYQEERDERGD